MASLEARARVVALALLIGSTACTRAVTGTGPAAIPLLHEFDAKSVTDSPASAPVPARTEWRFDGTGTVAKPEQDAETFGWRAIAGVDGLAVVDGKLCGRTSGDVHILAARLPAGLDAQDLMHALDLRVRLSAGKEIGVAFDDSEELDEKKLVDRARKSGSFWLRGAIEPGDDARSVLITSAQTSFAPSFPLSSIRWLLIEPGDAPDADFALESLRLITRREHLASTATGLGWHGLSDVYREAVAARAPERFAIECELPARPWLDLAIGTLDDTPVTFRVAGEFAGGRRELLRRTVTTANRWEAIPLDLAALAGARGKLEFALESDHPGAIGFWGTLVVRNRGAAPVAAADAASRTPIAGAPPAPPQGVILIVADTLRRDHLQAYGYERPTAPVLARLAQEGALFTDDIAQGTWTKVSIPSILSSLYPSTHGIVDMPDRLPASVTTLAEAFHDAGYATFATSSVPFSGKLSNLHQGVDVLHERDSVPEEGSKTARTFVDRFLPWLEEHRDGPFFAFLHVFDPHSPFEPRRPWDAEWTDAETKAVYDAGRKKLDDVIESAFLRRMGLATTTEMQKAGVDPAPYLRHEMGWYDGSIRAMDAEIGRVLERLETLGLRDRVVVVFLSDHGEEFLEHGRHWHGHTTYGEMLNVPLIVNWPGTLPGGLRVADTVRSIDVMPTLLDLAGIPRPARVQGQSLVPLLAAPANPESLGWQRLPAFSERVRQPSEREVDPRDTDSLSIVWDGWKLIRNTRRPADAPEFELYDHAHDPLDLHDVAAEHPELVESLGARLDDWHRRAVEARVPRDEDTADSLDADTLDRLRSLGYVR